MEWMIAFPSYQMAEPLPLSNNSQALDSALLPAVKGFAILSTEKEGLPSFVLPARPEAQTPIPADSNQEEYAP
jgi:hypothetical protein